KLTILNSAITGNAEHGVYLVGDDPENDGNAPIVAGVAAIEIIDTTFANNGFDNNYQGSGHIKLFGYQGNALFQNVAIEGAPDGTAQNDRPDNAIEITGYVDGNANPVGSDAPDIGTVVFDNVTVTGAYHKNPVALFNYSGIDGLTITKLNL